MDVGVDGGATGDAAGGHVGVSFRVDVLQAFPWHAGAKLYKNKRKRFVRKANKTTVESKKVNVVLEAGLKTKATGARSAHRVTTRWLDTRVRLSHSLQFINSPTSQHLQPG